MSCPFAMGTTSTEPRLGGCESIGLPRSCHPSLVSSEDVHHAVSSPNVFESLSCASPDPLFQSAGLMGDTCKVRFWESFKLRPLPKVVLLRNVRPSMPVSARSGMSKPRFQQPEDTRVPAATRRNWFVLVLAIMVLATLVVALLVLRQTPREESIACGS